MATLPWIKMPTNFFALPKVRLVRAHENGERAIVTYWTLYAEAGAINLDGLIALEEERPLTVDELSIALNLPKERIIEDTDILTKYGLLGIAGEGFYITSWDYEQAADKLAKRRENDNKRSKKRYDKKKEASKKDLGSDLDSESEKDSDSEKEKELSRENHVRNWFNELYDAYPKKLNYDEALEYYNTLSLNEQLHTEMIIAAKNLSCRVEKGIDDIQYVKSLHKWLRDQAWKEKRKGAAYKPV